MHCIRGGWLAKNADPCGVKRGDAAEISVQLNMTTFPSHARSVTLESASWVALKLKYTAPAHFRFPVTCIGSKILIMALSYATRVVKGGMKIVCFAIVRLWLIQGTMCKNTPTCQLVVKCVIHKLWIIKVWGARREPRGAIFADCVLCLGWHLRRNTMLGSGN